MISSSFLPFCTNLIANSLYASDSSSFQSIIAIIVIQGFLVVFELIIVLLQNAFAKVEAVMVVDTFVGGGDNNNNNAATGDVGGDEQGLVDIIPVVLVNELILPVQ